MNPRGLWLLLLLIPASGCIAPGGSAEFSVSCSPPILEGNPATEATAGHPYSAHFTGGYNCGVASCFDLQAVNLPPGAEIDHYTKTVYWTPPASLAGTTQTLSIRTPPDPCGDSAYFSWRVTVLPAPVVLSFTADPMTVAAGGTTTLTPVFANGTGRIVIWTGGSIEGVQSGVPVVSPPMVVTTTFELDVTDRLGNGTSQTVTVQVQ